MRLGRRALLAAAVAPAAAVAQPARLPPPVPVAPGGTAPPVGTANLPLDDRVASGWRALPLIRWGDRVLPGPPWSPDRPETEAAATQFGWDAVVAGVITPPLAADGIRRAILAVAHPTLDPVMAMPAARADEELAGAMQGASIVNLQYQANAGRWAVIDGGFQSRRITAATFCRLSGPVVGDPALQSPAETGADGTRGLIAPVGGCATPWGTILFAEGDPEIAAQWGPRRLADAAARARHGWIVELDVLDPTTLPVMRTAVGRRAHGGVAATRAADGRAVLYLSEARTGGFLFRFVSSARIATGESADNSRLLDAGTLHVARRAGDRGVWVRLPDSNAARLDPHAAASQLGATPLDVPGGIAVAPDGRVFAALRGDPLAGPERAGGRVLELAPQGGDAAAESFDVATLLAVPPGLRPAGPDAVPAAPTALALDGAGRLWVGTAQGAVQAETGAPDGVFLVPTDGASRGAVRRIYSLPRGASAGGVGFLPGEDQVVTAVRHPGAERGASFRNPVTRWPAFDPALPPRSTVIVLSGA